MNCTFKSLFTLLLISAEIFCSDRSEKQEFLEKWFNAVVQDKQEIIAKMVEDKNVKKTLKNIALGIAIIQGNIRLIELLLKCGADPNYTYYAGNKTETPLLKAFKKIQFGEVKVITKLDQESHFEYQVKPSLPRESKNYLQIIKLLIRYGADINYNFKLLLALRQSLDPEIMEILLKAGLNYNVNLQELAEFDIDPKKVMKKLAKEEIDSLIKSQIAIDLYKDMIFDCYEKQEIETFQKYFNRLIKLIHSKKYLTNIFVLLKDKNNNTLLHKAAAHGDLDLIKQILSYNPNVIDELITAPNNQNMTPIDLSATHENILEYFTQIAYNSKYL